MNRLANLLKKVEIHPVLWVVAALAAATGRFFELAILMFIVFVHELGHGVAASFFSWRIRKISLLPFGGMAEMDEHGNRSLAEETIVILAGPFQHLLLLACAFFLHEISILPAESYSLFVQYNLIILIFNLLPIWPLDGGKLLFLLLSLRYPFQYAHLCTLAISGGGLLAFVLLIFWLAPFTLNIWVILVFLAFSLFQEWKRRRYLFMRFLMDRYYGKQNDIRLLKPLKVREEEAVIHVLERFQRGCKHPIIIMGNGKEKGFLDENELLHAYFAEKLLTAKMGDLLYTYS